MFVFVVIAECIVRISKLVSGNNQKAINNQDEIIKNQNTRIKELEQQYNTLHNDIKIEKDHRREDIQQQFL